MKFSADAESEIKSTHRRSDFTHRRCISHYEVIFHPPVRVDLVEKSSLKLLFSGPPEGIRTPVLQNRNLLRYPTAPRAEIMFTKAIYNVLVEKSSGRGRRKFIAKRYFTRVLPENTNRESREVSADADVKLWLAP